MSTINREWHERNRMPRNPTEYQRIAWHLEHAKHCGCREISGGVAELLKQRGIPVPNFGEGGSR